MSSAATEHEPAYIKKIRISSIVLCSLTLFNISGIWIYIAA